MSFRIVFYFIFVLSLLSCQSNRNETIVVGSDCNMFSKELKSIPKSFIDVRNYFNTSLRGEVIEMISASYATSKGGENRFYLFINEFLNLLDETTRSSGVCYSIFRNEVIEAWELGNESLLTSELLSKGLDKNSVFNVLFQVYGAMLNEESYSIDVLISKELMKQQDFE